MDKEAGECMESLAVLPILYGNNRRTSSRACFYCGSSAHWATACAKKNNRDKEPFCSSCYMKGQKAAGTQRCGCMADRAMHHHELRVFVAVVRVPAVRAAFLRWDAKVCPKLKAAVSGARGRQQRSGD